MKRTLQVTATVSAVVPHSIEFGSDLPHAEVEASARKAVEAVLRRCFEPCERVSVKITATVKEGGQ